MNKQAIGGEIEIKTVSIHGQKGTFDATQLIISCSIYESIYQQGTMAEFLFRDDKNISSMFPLSGEETITFDFCTPSLANRRYEMQVFAIQGVAAHDAQRARAYALKATAKEVLQHKKQIVQKHYNTNISQMIQDIVSNFLGARVNVQQTKGIQKIIIPSLKPYKAIDMLRRRAVSESDKSSSFLFFQNKEGYHFKTIENMMETAGVKRAYTYKKTINTDIKPSTFLNALAWYLPQQQASLDRVGQGGFMSEVSTFNMKTQEYKRKVLEPALGSFKAADGILKDVLSGNFKNAVKKVASQAFIPEDKYKPDTHIAESTADQKGYIAAVTGGAIMVHVNGDSELTVGDKFSIEIWDADASTGNASLNPHVSGNYLVTKLRHIVGPPHQRPRYTCSVEGLKIGVKSN